METDRQTDRQIRGLSKGDIQSEIKAGERWAPG